MGISRVGADGWVREDLTDQVNGVQTVFTTTYQFQPGTLEVAVNGIDQGPPSMAFIELTPDTFSFDVFILRVHPHQDRLTVRYLPRQ